MSLKRVVSQGNGTFEARDLTKFSYGTSTVQKAYLGTDLVYYNAPDGAILSVQISNEGSVPFGGTPADGDYPFEVLISFGGSGTGGEFTGTIVNGVLDSVSLVNPFGEGQDWTVFDLITIECDQINFASNPQIKVLSVV
jgi:hypothetical protein